MTQFAQVYITLNPKPLNPKPLNPKALNPKLLSPKPIWLSASPVSMDGEMHAVVGHHKLFKPGGFGV